MLWDFRHLKTNTLERMKVPERAGNVFPHFFSSLEDKKMKDKGRLACINVVQFPFLN